MTRPHTSAPTDAAVQPQSSASKPAPKRINVAVTPETVEALQRVIDQEGVSLTEAVRRLIGYGDFIYNAVRMDGAQVLVQTADSTREVVLL